MKAEWINMAKELPTDDGDVLCFNERRMFIGWYDRKRRRWWMAGASLAPELTHWMKLPKAPANSHHRPKVVQP